MGFEKLTFRIFSEALKGPPEPRITVPLAKKAQDLGGHIDRAERKLGEDIRVFRVFRV